MLSSSTYGYVPARFWLNVSIRVAGERISIWIVVNSLLTNRIDLVITAGVLVLLYGSEKKTEICCVFAPIYFGINLISQQIQYLFWNSIKPLLISPQEHNLNKPQYCSLLHISPEAIVWRMEADSIVPKVLGKAESGWQTRKHDNLLPKLPLRRGSSIGWSNSCFMIQSHFELFSVLASKR